MIDETKLKIDASDLWMVLSNASLKDGKTSVQILETLAEIASVVIVHRESDITVADVRMIHAQQTLLEHDRLRLKLDGLQEVAELELDASERCDAICNVLIHCSLNLKKHINGLRPQLKRSIQLVLFLSEVGLREERAHVRVLILDLLDIGI